MATTTQSATPQFRVQVESRGTVSAVTVSGELDAATAPKVHDALEKAYRAAEEMVVVDLTETSFCDSSGIETLLRFDRRATAGGLGVVVVGARPEVRRVFDLCGPAGQLSFA